MTKSDSQSVLKYYIKLSIELYDGWIDSSHSYTFAICRSLSTGDNGVLPEGRLFQLESIHPMDNILPILREYVYQMESSIRVSPIMLTP